MKDHALAIKTNQQIPEQEREQALGMGQSMAHETIPWTRWMAPLTQLLMGPLTHPLTPPSTQLLMGPLMHPLTPPLMQLSMGPSTRPSTPPSMQLSMEPSTRPSMPPSMHPSIGLATVKPMMMLNAM